jgi:hypothetical protein
MLAVGLALGACGHGSPSASRGPSAPGARLRALDSLADAGAHSAFSARYLDTFPRAGGSATLAVRYVQSGQAWVLGVDGTEVVTAAPHRGSQAGWLCARSTRTCLALSELPPVVSPPSVALVRPVLDGWDFRLSTHGYPTTAAALARRGVRLSFSSATYGGQPSRCVTMRFLGTRPRTERWCTTARGVLDWWSEGPRVVRLVALATRVPTSAFSLPYRLEVPKAARGPMGVLASS